MSHAVRSLVDKALVEEKFDNFLSKARAEAEIRVFLCGKGILRGDKTLSEMAELKTDKRAYLWHRLEADFPGCTVLLGEHDYLIKTFGSAFSKSSGSKNISEVNLARFEAALARHVHLIVIFPESPGSFAELGLFAAPGGMASKLFVIVEKKREHDPPSYLSRGPIATVKTEKGKVSYLDYDDLDSIYAAVSKEVEGLFEQVTTSAIFSKKDL